MGTAVYIAWGLVCLVTIASVGGGLYFGYTGRWTLVIWRRIKLVSTLFGVLAIAFLMLNAEGMWRNYWFYGLTPTNVLLFSDMRFEVAENVPEICSQHGRPSRACTDALSIQRSLEWFRSYLQSGFIEKYDERRYAPEIAKLIDSLNHKIGILQLQLRRPQVYWAPGVETRVILFFFAALLLAGALGGSVGEAAFQLRQAEEDARKKASALA